MMPLSHRLFVDPVDVFAGPGWMLFLPPLVFASTLVYHTLRCEETFTMAQVLRPAAWSSFKVLLVLGALALVLWLT